jgi:hypothetical protein
MSDGHDEYELSEDDFRNLKQEIRRELQREMERRATEKGKTNVSNVNLNDEGRTFVLEVDEEGGRFPPRCNAGVVKMGRMVRCSDDLGHDAGDTPTPHYHNIMVTWETYLPTAPTLGQRWFG